MRSGPWSEIGFSAGGEFAGSVVAVEFPSDEGDSFGVFRAWTPHRYVLSIEENEIPRDMGASIRMSLKDPVGGAFAASLVEGFFDADYIRVVHGPHEGRLIGTRVHSEVRWPVQDSLIALAMQTPLLQGMAASHHLDPDLVAALQRVSRQPVDDRDMLRLLKYCLQTVNWAATTVSPDIAVRMWFASLRVSLRNRVRVSRASHLRDARRMVQALLDPTLLWVSGDCSEGLCEIARLAVARLSSGVEEA